MTLNEPAFQAIARALGTGQIGKPVAVRLVDGTEPQREHLENRLAQALAVALVLGSLGGLYPAWRATRMQPVEALRYE